VKSSEGAVIANSLTSVVKLALDTNNETIKRIEAFYSGAIQQFSTNMQIFLGLFASIATLAGFFGFVTLRNIADETARRQAENALAPLLESNQVMRAEYEKLKGQHNSILEELEQARKSYSSIQEALGNLHQGAAANLHGLRSSILAWLNMIQYMQADDKLDFADRLEDAGQLIKEVLSEIKPDDKKVLSLTYSVYGLVLYYDNKFEEGLEALKKAVSEDSKNYRAAYNYACCACKLANDLDGKGESHRERTTALDEDALTSLELVLNLAPYKKTKVMHEQDFARLHRHERFASLTSR
jgi:tetratricopeptide (TPR) repeat protein